MRHWMRYATLAVVLALTAAGCQDSPDLARPPVGADGTPAFSILTGTETLGDPGIAIASGTGIVVAGVGLVGDPAVAQPGTININVPGAVQQVLLYWTGHMATDATDGTITVNGNPLVGTLIGGTTLFFVPAYSSTHRADITGLGLIGPGPNSIEIGGLDFTTFCPDCQNLGAGLLVIYDDGSTPAELAIKDGDDCAFYNFAPPLDTTVPQTFNFTAASSARTAKLSVFAGSVNDFVGLGRPNVIEVTIDGSVTRFVDALQGFSGNSFDAVTLDVNVPAGATSMTVQALSEKDPSSVLLGQPASFNWLVAAFAVTPEDEEEPPLACRVTGGGVDENYNWDGTWANGVNGLDSYTCGGQAGANTALPPQPKGEWTHNNHKGPSGSFVFHAGTASAPEGTEIDWIECSDPDNCDPAREAPAKQIDFGGVGTFKALKPNVPQSITDWVVVGESLHYFEVNIDDLGEPGRSGKQDPPASDCDPNGYGAGSGTELADCDCPDYYRITIYGGPDSSYPVIYQVSGYIRGGNFQIHPLTGFDNP